MVKTALAAGPVSIKPAEADIEILLTQTRDPLSVEERQARLERLLQLHEQVADSNPEAAQRARQAFLLTIEDATSTLEETVFRNFIANHVDPRDFATIQWDRPEDVVTIAEVLYGIRSQNELTAEQVTQWVTELTRQALRNFEKRRAYEMMIELLQQSPLPPLTIDAELMRVRNRLHLYEMRRVHRKRRMLYLLLLANLVLVLGIFPWLFIAFEDGSINRRLEQFAGIDLREEATQELTYADGVYWSIITAASVGYGDIAPVSGGGRLIAVLTGTTGVLTAGVIAGLVLNWITPRVLP